MLLLYHYFFIANFWRKCIRGISDINPLRQGSRSGSRNCGKKSKIHHFLEIVQYTCNTTFLYQNLIGNLKKQKMQISKYFSCYICFLWSCIDLTSKHKYLWKIHKMLFKFKLCLVLPPESKFTIFNKYSENKLLSSWVSYGL